MSEEKKKTIYEKIAETSLIYSARQLETNVVKLCGFVVHKPTFLNEGKIVSFDITTIHKTMKGITYQHYTCFSQAKSVIETFKEMTTVCLVEVHGSLRKIKGSYLPMIVKIKPRVESNYVLIRKEKTNGKGEEERN